MANPCSSCSPPEGSSPHLIGSAAGRACESHLPLAVDSQRLAELVAALPLAMSQSGVRRAHHPATLTGPQAENAAQMDRAPERWRRGHVDSGWRSCINYPGHIVTGRCMLALGRWLVGPSILNGNICPSATQPHFLIDRCFLYPYDFSIRRPACSKRSVG